MEFFRDGERFFSIKQLVNFPELFVIDLGILVVHQDAKDASESGFLTLEDPMAELLRGSKQELDLGFENP